MEVSEQKWNDKWKVSTVGSDILWFASQFFAYAPPVELIIVSVNWVLIQGQMGNWTLNWATDCLMAVLLTLFTWLSSKVIHGPPGTLTNTDIPSL